MDCGIKRKLDIISSEMEVLPPDAFYLEQSKRVRLSIQLGTSSVLPDRSSTITDITSCSETLTDAASTSWEKERRCTPNEMDYEDKLDLEDIPSTAEVINSLRKVILWMSAQGDHSNDHIQYLTDVERYAQSKQLNHAQQRKITEYLIRRE